MVKTLEKLKELEAQHTLIFRRLREIRKDVARMEKLLTLTFLLISALFGLILGILIRKLTLPLP